MTYEYDGAIFDMDGTLLNSMRYWRYTGLEYLLKHDLPVEPDMLVRMLDTSSRYLLNEYLQKLGLPCDWNVMIQELEGYMDRHYQADIRMKPHVPEFLQALRRRGTKLCVATAVTRDIAVRALEKQGIAQMFDFITDIHEFGLDKTKPEYFRVVADRLGCAPQRCMVFEDALYSMTTAKKAELLVCGIEDITARLHREEIQSLCDVYIRDYAELL